LGCDTDAADASVSEFLPNGNKLNLVCADAGGSISIMNYDAQVGWEGGQGRGMGGGGVEACDAIDFEGWVGLRRGGILLYVVSPAGQNNHLTNLITCTTAEPCHPPQDPESWGGKKLLHRGAAHVGALATRLARMRMTVPGDNANRQALLVATREGGVGLLASCWDEDMARRLASMQVGGLVGFGFVGLWTWDERSRKGDV